MLGIWVQPKEGAAFWTSVCANLANRGVRDVLIVATEGLSGFPEAVEATWPNAIIHKPALVYLIRASMRFVAYKDRKAVARGLRPIYTAPSEEAAVKLLWLAIINIEEKRAREREKEKGRKRGENRKAKGYLMEGQMTTNWKQALTQLAVAFPDRMEPHL